MKVLVGVLMAMAISVTDVNAQNTAVTWSVFNVGFAATVSATTKAQSVAGQLVVGSAQSATAGTETGFIPGVPGILTAVQNSVIELPTTYMLEQNYPNPFNPATTISFSLPSKSTVSLRVFDALGREVAVLLSQELPAGNYSHQWNAEGFSSGVYFYRLVANAIISGQAGSFTETKKLVLLR